MNKKELYRGFRGLCSVTLPLSLSLSQAQQHNPGKFEFAVAEYRMDLTTDTETRRYKNCSTTREKDSKNDKLPPGRVKGTTIIGVVVADAILIAGEGRTISAEEDDKGQILSGDHEKIVKINDDFLATFSGYIHEGEKLIKTVRDALSFEVEVSMSLLQRRCKEYMIKWKLERRRNKKNEEYLREVQVYHWRFLHWRVTGVEAMILKELFGETWGVRLRRGHTSENKESMY